MRNLFVAGLLVVLAVASLAAFNSQLGIEALRDGFLSARV
jgi:hypothetical protein